MNLGRLLHIASVRAKIASFGWSRSSGSPQGCGV
jgi:hypothetical protein